MTASRIHGPGNVLIWDESLRTIGKMAEASTRYDESFYHSLRHGESESPKEVVPILIELLHPRSIVDVGAGLGGWLSVFRERGVSDVLGIEGEWISDGQMLLPPTLVMRADLTKPFRIDRVFDVALCLEVAEHLPATAADTLVESLVRLSDVVVFSAAIPGQGGTNHINEQWPEYWATRFAQHGYRPADSIRRRIWTNPRVDFYYAQNMLVYVRRERLPEFPGLLDPTLPTDPSPMSLVHPTLWTARIDRIDIPFTEMLTLLEKWARAFLRRKLRTRNSLGRLRR